MGLPNRRLLMVTKMYTETWVSSATSTKADRKDERK